MRTLAEDTHPEAERKLLELLRTASPARKLEMVLAANHTARELALTGLRERYPNESPARLRRRLADLWLGPELAAKAYGLCLAMNERPGELLAAGPVHASPPGLE